MKHSLIFCKGDSVYPLLFAFPEKEEECCGYQGWVVLVKLFSDFSLRDFGETKTQ